MRLLKKILSTALSLVIIASCVPLSGISVFAATTPANLTSIKYELDNNTDGFAGGTVTITSPSANIGMDCVMYWADSSGKPLSEFTNLTPFEITATTTQFEMYENIIIPEDAKKLIAYASNEGTFSSGYVSYNLPNGAAYQIDDSKFIYEFQMVSDTHIIHDWDGYNNKFVNFLNDVAANSPDSAGIFVCGDFVNDGIAEQFEKAVSLYQSVSGIPKMSVSFGNHDWRDVDEETFAGIKYLKKFNSDIDADSVYYDYWLNGYHHIMLCSDWDTWSSDSYAANISDAQLAWLDNLLAEDSKNNPDKPVFVMMHEPIHDTVAGTFGGYNDDIYNVEQYKKVLRKYGQVVLFSGHSHSAFDSRDNMFNGSEDKPIAFNTSSTADPWNYETELYTSTSEGYYIRVYEDKVVLLGREFTSHKFMPTALHVIEQQKVSVPETSYDMKVGDASININAASATGAQLTYVSSNESVATVDENGNVTPLRAGKAVITVTAGATATHTIARRSVAVNVTDSKINLATLPYDFYANVSTDNKCWTIDSNNIVNASSADTINNQWRFTKLYDGTYKITFKGTNDLALKQTLNANGSYSLETSAFEYSPEFYWFIYENADGSIVLINSANYNSSAIDVKITQTANLEDHQYPNSVDFTDGKRCLAISGEIITTTGWHNSTNGKSYYINSNNLVHETGLQLIDGNYYFLNENTGEKEIGWHKALNEKWYYTNDDGIVQTGWHKYGDYWYYFSQETETYGQMHTGILYDDSGKYYYLDDVNGEMKIGWYRNSEGKWYYLDSVGVMQFGWFNYDDEWYYLSREEETLGQMHRGILCATTGDYYYFGDDDGIMKKGIYTNSAGATYCLDDTGIMQFGWIETDGNWYYYSREEETLGQMYKGILCATTGDYYYLGDEDGIMKTGWYRTTDGRWYYLSDEGIMQFGWQDIDGERYYLSEADETLGQLQRGWLEHEGKTYYLAYGGEMQTGFQEIDGYKYYFDSNGVMLTGWLELDGKWYYFNEDGTMVKGWFTSSTGAVYYFGTDDYAVSGWQLINGEWYYFLDDCKMYTGWLESSTDVFYYFYPDTGIMARSTWILTDGVWEYVGGDGIKVLGAEWADGSTYDGAVNLGDDFYAFINVSGADVKIGVETDEALSTYKNVEVQTERSKHENVNAQIWHFALQSDGSYIITNVATGKYLSVENGGIASSTNVNVGSIDPSITYKWYVFENGDAYGLVAQCNVWDMTVLDVADGLTNEGTNVQITSKSDTASQKFVIETVDLNDYTFVRGDVDGDGVVNVRDATRLQEYLVNRTALTEDLMYNCDADKNGRININDVTYIQYYCVGLIEKL